MDFAEHAGTTLDGDEVPLLPEEVWAQERGAGGAS
jgi:hypothetical protein